MAESSVLPNSLDTYMAWRVRCPALTTGSTSWHRRGASAPRHERCRQGSSCGRGGPKPIALVRGRRGKLHLSRSQHLIYKVLIASWVTVGLNRGGCHNHLVSFCRFIDRKLNAIVNDHDRLLGTLKSAYESIRRSWVMKETPSRQTLGQVMPNHLIDSFLKLVRKDESLLYALSGAKRGLPPPSARQTAKALEKHREMVTTRKDGLPLYLYNRYVNWLKSPYFKNMASSGEIGLISHSSCLGYTKRQGGRLKWALDLVRGPHLLKVYAAYQRAVNWSREYPFPNREALSRKIVAEVKNTIKGVLTVPSFTTCEPLAIPEFGYKTRIVTKSNPESVALAHEHRERLYALLFDIPETVEGVKSEFNPIPIIERDDYFVFSSDLSKATDTLSKQGVGLFCSTFGIPPGLLCENRFPDGTPWESGIPMGMPCSWSVLSLIHYFCAKLATESKHHRLKIIDKTVNVPRPFRIKGDDLIAYWPRDVIRRYRYYVRCFGLIPKIEASYIHRSRGLYCEKPYEVRNGELCPLEGYFTLKTFVKAELPREIWKAELPQLSIGQTMHSLVEQQVPREIICKLQSIFFGKLIGACKRSRIDPFVPKSFGGLGMVPEDPLAYPSVHYQKCAHYIHNHPSVSLRAYAGAYPKGSYGRYMAEKVAAGQTFKWAFEGQTNLLLTEDTFTPWFANTAAVMGLVLPATIAPASFSRYLKALHRENARKGKLVNRQRVFIRRTYAKLYDLESRLKVIKVTLDHACSSEQEKGIRDLEYPGVSAADVHKALDDDVIARVNKEYLQVLRERW